MSGHQPLTPSQMDQSYLVNVGRAKWISFYLLPQTPVSKMVCPLVTFLNLDHFRWADLSQFSKFVPQEYKNDYCSQASSTSQSSGSVSM